MKFFNSTKIILLFFFFCGFLSCKKDNPYTGIKAPVAHTFPVFENIGDIAMYEINFRAFSNSGDISGVIDRLDSIKKLGINVIWLMPHYPIGQLRSINSPYCIKNYVDVNPELGNIQNMKALVNEAHKRDIAIIIDWVANHTSWDHPWIANKDWYTQDAAGNIVHPPGTNWQDVADLNFTNAEMRLEMIKSMKFWVENVLIDGFRCDAADYVPLDFWKQAIDSLRLIPNRKLLMFAEGERKNHFDAGFDMNFGWDFFGTGKNVFGQNQSAGQFFNAQNREYATLPPNTHPVRFTTNHDENNSSGIPQVIYGGENGALAAFVATAYLGGVPMIYNGQEVGCETNLAIFSATPIDWNFNNALLAKYQQLMAIRKNNSALRTGTLTNLATSQVVGFTRKTDNNEAFVIINTRNENVSYTIPSPQVGTTWKDAQTEVDEVLSTSISLAPYQFKILVKTP